MDYKPFQITFSVNEYKIVETDLPSEEFAHVHFVCVQRAEKDLENTTLLVKGFQSKLMSKNSNGTSSIIFHSIKADFHQYQSNNYLKTIECLTHNYLRRLKHAFIYFFKYYLNINFCYIVCATSNLVNQWSIITII